MRSSLTDSARWPWWLAAVLIALLIGAWWQPWLDAPDSPATVSGPLAAPAPTPMTADRMLESDAPGPSAPMPRFKLEGTVMAGAGSFAMVRETADSQPLLLRVGDRIGGLAVTAIKSGSIALSGSAGPVVIEVGTRTVAAATAAAAQPATPNAATLPPPVISVEHLPEAYRGPAPENEVLGH